MLFLGNRLVKELGMLFLGTRLVKELLFGCFGRSLFAFLPLFPLAKKRVLENESSDSADDGASSYGRLNVFGFFLLICDFLC